MRAMVGHVWTYEMQQRVERRFEALLADNAQLLRTVGK